MNDQTLIRSNTVKYLEITIDENLTWCPPGHGMEWNENFDTEYERCQNGIEWKISRME